MGNAGNKDLFDTTRTRTSNNVSSRDYSANVSSPNDAAYFQQTTKANYPPPQQLSGSYDDFAPQEAQQTGSFFQQYSQPYPQPFSQPYSQPVTSQVPSKTSRFQQPTPQPQTSGGGYAYSEQFTKSSQPPPQQQSTGGLIRMQSTPPSPQQSTGGFSEQVYNSQQFSPPPKSFDYTSNLARQLAPSSRKSRDSSPILKKEKSVTKEKKEEKSSYSSRKPTLARSTWDTKRKEEVGEEEYLGDDIDLFGNDDDDEFVATKKPPQLPKEIPLPIDVVFNYSEKKQVIPIDSTMNLVQLIRIVQQKYKALQKVENDSIELYYNHKDFGELLIGDEDDFKNVFKYFRDNPQSPSIRIAVAAEVSVDQDVMYKFQVDYVNTTLQPLQKKFNMNVNTKDTLEKFIANIEERCSLPTGLHTIQFFDLSFNEYIDVTDMKEMTLSTTAVNLIKMKKSSSLKAKEGKSGDSFNPLNPFVGLVVMNKYRITEQIGRGGFGCVVSCEDVNTKEKRAIKFILSGDQSDNEDIRQAEINAKKEASFMQQLQHPHIAKVTEVFTWKEVLDETPTLRGNTLFSPLLGIVMEQYEFGNLMQKIIVERGNRGPIPISLVFQIVFQIAQSIEFIHRREIIHRDIKPHNILIRSYDESKNEIDVVLSDFGTAKADIHTTRHTQIGTLLYESPEVILHHSYGLSADIFSFGVTLFQLLSLNVSFSTCFQLIQNEKDCLEKVTSMVYANYSQYEEESSYKEAVLKGLVDLLMKMLRLTPQERITSEQLVKELEILELEILSG